MASKVQEICVVGLGYVGLPLAVALAKRFKVTGFDIDRRRIAELTSGHDRTREVEAAALKASKLRVTDDATEIARANIVIVTVPTPVSDDNLPDLGAVRSACASVGKHLAKGAIVVFESTVYPSVTEDVCGPDLEQASGFKCGKDFFLGYSPERINPGDREHTIDRITKVIAGQTPEVVAVLTEVYSAVTKGGVFTARDIRTAEAAKVIENAQRDINIAFINEVTMIFQKLGLSTYDVLDAARTKWNFLGFTPGLVGGHCIGVDPFYLSFCAQQLGHDPAVILAGRRINDGMGEFIARQIGALLKPKSKVLMLGLTFKENVPDLRNTKVVNVIDGLTRRGHTVDLHDPLADADEAHEHYGLALAKDIYSGAPYHAVVGAVAHDAYKKLTGREIEKLLVKGGLVADIKGLWRGVEWPVGLAHWQL